MEINVSLKRCEGGFDVGFGLLLFVEPIRMDIHVKMSNFTKDTKMFTMCYKKQLFCGKNTAWRYIYLIMIRLKVCESQVVTLYSQVDILSICEAWT